MPKKKNASSLISELKRKTRRNYSSEEKIRIVIEGMRGEMTIADAILDRIVHSAHRINLE